jgi:predicted nucleotidyltransferase
MPHSVDFRHNPFMNLQPVVTFLQQRLPRLLAVYAFGSRVASAGQHARPDSDLDLAVLVEGYADPVLLFDLAQVLADVAHCPVDLLDLRVASTVMQHQVLTTGERLWAKDVRAGLFEAAMLTEKLHLDEMRQAQLRDIHARGTVYGR